MRHAIAPLLLVLALLLAGSSPPPGPKLDPEALGEGLSTLRVAFVSAARKRVVYLPARVEAKGGDGLFETTPGADRITVATTLSLTADTAEVEELARRARAIDPDLSVERGTLSTFAMGLTLGEVRVFVRERTSGDPAAVPVRFVTGGEGIGEAGVIQWTALLVYTAEALPVPYELAIDAERLAGEFAIFAAASGGHVTRDTYAAFIAEAFAAGAIRAAPVDAAPGDGAPGDGAGVTENDLRERAADLLAETLLDLSGPPVPGAAGPGHPPRGGLKPDGIPASFDLTAGGHVERSIDLLEALPFGRAGK